MLIVKGYIYVIISGILFGCMPLFANIFYNNGITSLSLVLYRFLLSIPVLYIICKRLNIDLKIKKREFKDLLLISIFGYSSTAMLLYLSYNFIPSGLSTSLHFTYPVIITAACIVIYKEKLDIIKILCSILCTVGIFLFLNEINLTGNSFLGILLAIASGFTYSYYMIFLEKSSLDNMETFKVVLYLCIISSIFLFIYNIIFGTLVVKMKPIIFFALVIFSIVITIGAVTLFQKGLNIIGAQNTSILSTSEPITSVILGITLFDEPSTLKVILGIIFIILSVILLSLNDKYRYYLKNENN